MDVEVQSITPWQYWPSLPSYTISLWISLTRQFSARDSIVFCEKLCNPRQQPGDQVEVKFVIGKVCSSIPYSAASCPKPRADFTAVIASLLCEMGRYRSWKLEGAQKKSLVTRPCRDNTQDVSVNGWWVPTCPQPRKPQSLTKIHPRYGGDIQQSMAPTEIMPMHEYNVSPLEGESVIVLMWASYWKLAWSWSKIGNVPSHNMCTTNINNIDLEWGVLLWFIADTYYTSILCARLVLCKKYKNEWTRLERKVSCSRSEAYLIAFHVVCLSSSV